jgi:hypothetical protein
MWSTIVDVVCNVELVAVGIQLGFFYFTKETMSVICGVSMLVPDIMENPSPA